MQDCEADASTASAAQVLSYRQRLEKQAGGEIALMKWSPTMDLLAATFKDNTVIVNRLSWQRVWSVPGQDGTPTALAWRPDGKVLAVGRSDATISLLGVEDGRTLHTHTFASPVASLQWMMQDRDSSRVEGDGVEYKDRSLSFLPPLPSLEHSDSLDSESHTCDARQMQPTSKQVDVLLVGDKSGVVHVCVGGVFCATTLGVNGQCDTSQETSHVMITCLSRDLKLLSAVSLVSDGKQNSTLHLQTVVVSLICQRCRELQHLSLHYTRLCSLLEYTSATLHHMHEAWEDLLLMVDAKLAQYATTLQEGTTVSDELLLLLACGRVRSELQEFLVNELTAKGVKKIGLSLEMSYTSVRKYSLTCLSSVIQALQFHLCEVLGMAQWKERFGALGISTEKLQICLNSLGTFALKNHELQSVIDESLKSMKAFFTWLYIVILKLGEEPIPPNIKKHLNAEELKLVIQFLKKRLAKATDGSSQTFNLELVGQYLVDEDLKIIAESPPSLWEKLLKEAKLNPEAIPCFFSPSPKKSLLQLLNSLIQDIHAAFATTKSSLSVTFVPKLGLSLLRVPEGELVSDGKRCIYFPCDTDIVLLVYDEQQAMKCCRFCVRDVPTLADQEQSSEPVKLLSVQVYNAEALSILFEYSNSEREDISVVAQLPVDSLVSLATDILGEHSFQCCESCDVGYLLTQVHSLGPFHATSLAVSGSRRLAAVVSHRSKKVRLFDVDAEEEEEEEEEDGEGEGEGGEGEEGERRGEGEGEGGERVGEEGEREGEREFETEESTTDSHIVE